MKIGILEPQFLGPYARISVDPLPSPKDPRGPRLDNAAAEGKGPEAAPTYKMQGTPTNTVPSPAAIGELQLRSRTIQANEPSPNQAVARHIVSLLEEVELTIAGGTDGISPPAPRHRVSAILPQGPEPVEPQKVSGLAVIDVALPLGKRR